MIQKLRGYITRQSHDQVKVRQAGLDEWRNFILPLLDEKRTFGGDNPLIFLKEAHKTIINGEHLVARGADSDLNLAFQGPGNLGKRLSQHRVLHFKNADAWMAYNERFGTGTLREAVLGEFSQLLP